MPLTGNPGLQCDASFSPDGNQVAYVWNGEKQDNFDIYVKLIGGGAPLRPTTNPARDFSPAWSPDGRTIAFLRLVSGRALIMSVPALGGPNDSWGRRSDKLVPGVSSLLLGACVGPEIVET